MTEVNGKSKTLIAREAKEAESLVRFNETNSEKQEVLGLEEQQVTKTNGKPVKSVATIKAVRAMTKAASKTKVKRQAKDAKALYEERQAFVAKHSKVISAEWHKQGDKASWGSIHKALPLLGIRMVGYTLVKLGLLVTKDHHALDLVVADGQFTKVSEVPAKAKANGAVATT